MTGLNGQYDIALDIAMAELNGAPVRNTDASGANGREALPAESIPAPGNAPPLLQSLKELGLELKNRRAPVEYVIVDHAEKVPTEN